MNTKGFSYNTEGGLFGAYTEKNNKEGSTPLYETFVETPNESRLLIKNTERKDMNCMSDEGAWSCGNCYGLLLSEQEKAEYILSFDSELASSYKHNPLYMTVLQNAFAVGANGLPFSEVKKG